MSLMAATSSPAPASQRPVSASPRPAPASQRPVPASLLAGASVPPGWQVDDATGDFRREILHSMLRRRTGWNYKGVGWYMVTLTLADRSRGWLGELVVGEAPSSKLEGTGLSAGSAGSGAGGVGVAFSDFPAPEDCRIALTPLGKIVNEVWQEINDNWPGVEALDLQVMPEHLHGIIHVASPQRHPLGQIVGSFKARVMARVKAALGLGTATGEALASKLASTGAMGEAEEGAAVATAIGQVPASLLAGASLWSPGLQDSILWSLLRRERATHYLHTNPYRLALKRQFPWLFQVTRDFSVGFGDGWVGRFSAIGNQFLLEAPELVQVQCSRSFFRYRRDVRGNLLKDAPPEVETEEFREKWALASKLASTGAVLVSPCISHGEREIARRAFKAGYRVITLANKGFSPLYKPGGKLFEHCAVGNLLMLAPIAWPYLPGEKRMTRADALALNVIAGWLVGGVGSTFEQARRHLATGHLATGHLERGGSQTTIDYRGVRLENTDQLAAEAIALSKSQEIR